MPLRTGFAFFLTSAYCVLVAGFAGWCGTEFWTWPNVSLVVLPPVGVALIMAVRGWQQTPLLPALVFPLLGGLMLGVIGLTLAAIIGALAERWPSPAVRAAVGAAVAALGFGMTWTFYIRPRRAAPPETDGSQGGSGPGLTSDGS
jgi:hypothetical protein